MVALLKKKNILQQCLSEENALQSFIGYAQSQERVIKKKKKLHSQGGTLEVKEGEGKREERRGSFKHFRPPWWKEMKPKVERGRQRGSVISLTSAYILSSLK